MVRLKEHHVPRSIASSTIRLAIGLCFRIHSHLFIFTMIYFQLLHYGFVPFIHRLLFIVQVLPFILIHYSFFTVWFSIFDLFLLFSFFSFNSFIVFCYFILYCLIIDCSIDLSFIIHLFSTGLLAIFSIHLSFIVQVGLRGRCMPGPGRARGIRG